MVRAMTDYAGKQSNTAAAGPGPTTSQAGPGVGKSTLVGQIQAPVGANTETGTVPAAPSALARVQAAAFANDLPGLIAIQVELVAQLQQQASDPPKDLRDGVAFARTWTMDQIAAIRDKYEPQVAAAKATTAQGTDNHDKVEALEAQEDKECTPYLDALLKGDPQYRYQHFKQDVQAKVFDAVRLHSSQRGLAQVGHRGAAETEARDLGGLPTGSWCGVFAYAQAAQAGGMDPHWRQYMQGEGGIRSALNYAGMNNVWVWAFDHWEGLKQYHQSRGSLRYYEVLGKGLPTRQVQAGDIALLDRDFGVDPDHIITVASFDGRYLYTIGGNQGGAQLDDETGVSKSGPFDLSNQPEPNDVTELKRDENGELVLDKQNNPIKGHKKGMVKNTRIHGIGRWSLVDYETHVYATSEKMPSKPPADASLSNAQAGNPKKQ